MMRVTENLRRDHLVIKRLRDIAKRCSDLLYQGRDIPYEDIKSIVIAIEDFIDKCHHGKEECFYFPRVGEEMKEEVRALIIEHEFGRRVAAMVARYIVELKREPVARLLNAYVTFLDTHMEREEKFFNILDEHLDESLIDYSKMKDYDLGIIKLEGLISELEKKEWMHQ